MTLTPINNEYENALERILTTGTTKTDRTGVGTRSLFGLQMRFNLQEAFPLITTKRVFWKGIVEELLWFLNGDTNSHTLEAKGVNIWKEWADENGELGPIYSAMWRAWPTTTGETIDQISELIHNIKTSPDSRRLIVSAWNPELLPQQALPPCHTLFQFYVADGKLSCQLYQRSGDFFLGIPFNIASYSLLTHMIAQQTNLQVGEFIHTIGDAHIYTNHIAQVETQLARENRPHPQLKILTKPENIFSYTYDDFKVENYNPHPTIKGEVAI